MDETRTLAHFIQEVNYDDLPPQVVDKAKDLVLDQLGCQLAGTNLPWSKATYEYVKDIKGYKKESTIVFHGIKTVAQDAAFANANFGHGFLADDIDPVSNAHLGSIIISAALAMGEREKISGKEFIKSIVIGYDVALRIGAAARLAVRRGFHPGPVFGPFGAATATGMILRLTEDEMLNALALAGSHSSGLMEYTQSGGSVNRLHAGIAAYGGMRSSLLAQRGFTGPATILEGRSGFCQAFSNERFMDEITSGLKKNFKILGVEFKQYCCCGTQSAGLDALSKILNEHAFKPQQIKEIVISAPGPVLEFSSTITEPKDITSAQLSRRFGIALRILKGGNGFKEYTEENLSNPEIKGLINKIKYRSDDELGKRFPGTIPTKILIRLSDGTVFEQEVGSAIGTVQNPMSKDQIYNKFRKFASAVFPDNKIEIIITTIEMLDQIDNIRDLISLLV